MVLGPLYDGGIGYLNLTSSDTGSHLGPYSELCRVVVERVWEVVGGAIDGVEWFTV